MSLTAHILFNRPTQLPAGRLRTNSIGVNRRHETTAGREEHAARNTATKLASIEKIYNAIVSGFDTIAEIGDETDLSESTVKRGLIELEDCPDGARIKRIRGWKHRFVAIKKPK